MRLALVGQPNCGKSTLFNQVAGYQAHAGNFPGTTVSVTEGRLRLQGEVVDLADMPGTYTLAGANPAEQIVLPCLSSSSIDAVVNLVDATRLEQGLSLTLELLELQLPAVVALNVMDEAARLGMRIDGPRLQSLLGVPVLPLIASKGRGVRAVFLAAFRVARDRRQSVRPPYSATIEAHIHHVSSRLGPLNGRYSAEAIALRLLQEDPQWWAEAAAKAPEALHAARAAQQSIQSQFGTTAAEAISEDRRHLARQIAQEVVRQGERRSSLRDRLDDLLLNPILGYVFLLLTLLLLFQFVYTVGKAIEQPLVNLFATLALSLETMVPSGTLAWALISGVMQGIFGGVAIVLPYLIPFLLGLSFLEDVGYLPRIAFLTDSLMRRLGLDGKAVVPFILGYGCTVPAVMSTRILEARRDRFIAAALATLLPCAARLTVVFGLVAFYLGPQLALAIFLADLFLVALTARVLSGLLAQESPGLILEMPSYRVPMLRGLLRKSAFRVQEFIVQAWPILIAGSVALSLLTYFHADALINALMRPLTWILGLPAATGIPLIFGVLRKELSMVMLSQALGGADFSVGLTPVQMVTYTVFVVLYLPCLATLAVLRREFGARQMIQIAGLTVLLALAGAVVARGLSVLFVG
jgi:ferrous iron transport protein B